jgi:serine/threonine-protein phosphatase 2B catalytic subunit
LLWSDPMTDEDANENEFADNKERECSYLFGKKPTKKLLDTHNLMSIVRAHQVQIEGYKMHRWDGESSFPYVITLFSAPNYCDYYSNKAAVLILKDGGISIKQYDQSEHPYYLPDQLDVFSWSMPFLAEKVISLMAFVLKYTTDDVDEEEEAEVVSSTLSTAEKMKKFGKIKTKIKIMARMQKMFSTLKDESELLIKIKGMAPDGKIPRGLLLDGRPAIRDSFREFTNASKLDMDNEKLPKY